ncbi:MAG: hypothetical protein K2O18_00050 [Oscillospiraceae bacterium]|nr:hypothetical protein [Oscillospiraceae bacterium]
MNKQITEDLTLVEQRIQFGSDHYSRYITKYFIDNDLFSAAVKRLGGYTYNICVGKIGTVTIFNGLTWLSVHGADSYEDCDMWAERFEQALFEGVGTISPVCVHHPVPGLHSWGIEFNRDRIFWNNPDGVFVREAKKFLEDGWFYQSGSDHPDQGYQFFEFMELPSKTSERLFHEEPEYIARAAAVKIAKNIGSIAFF